MARWQSPERVRPKHRLESMGLRAGVSLLRSLSEDRALAMGVSLADTLWRLGVRREVTEDNIRRAAGVAANETEVRDIARAAYHNLGRVFAEYARMPDMTDDDLRYRVSYDHIDRLRQMSEVFQSRGYLGGWDLLVVEDEGALHNEQAWSRRFPAAVEFLFPAD